MPRTLSGDAEAVVDVPVVGGEVVITSGATSTNSARPCRTQCSRSPRTLTQRPDLRRLQQPSVPAPPSWSNNTDGVDVTFASGHEERFHIVGGAEGLHSALRDYLLSPQEQHLEHLGIYLCFWTAANHLNLKNWTLVYSEPGRTIGMRSILDDTKVMAFLGFRGGPPSYDWSDLAAQKRIALARASGMGWEAAQLLSEIETADDFWFDTCTQVQLPRWSTGRAVLLGDAAWCTSPLTGHGTTLAIVGAYVLAGELAAAGGNHTIAFTRYGDKLRLWVRRICQSARVFGAVMIPQTILGIRLRNELAQLLQHVLRKSRAARNLTRMTSNFGLEDYGDPIEVG